MTLFLCWAVFPLVLGVLALGSGLALEHASGVRLPGVLLLPTGLAVMVVVAGFATVWDATAQLAAPAAVTVATVGLLSAAPWRGRVLEGWAVLAGLATYAAYGAPILLSGEATFAGYITLDDTSTWLALVDRVMEHGQSLAGLAPSSYEATLDNYLGAGYPTGSFLPLGIGHELVGQDVAWLFQPTIAFQGAMLALGLYALAGGVVESRLLRALVALVAAQPALLFAYSLWSGVKELTAAAGVALLAALVARAVEAGASARWLLPPAVATASLLVSLSVGGVAWAGPVLAYALVIALRMRGRAVVGPAAVFFLVTLALALPSLVAASSFVGHAADTESLTSSRELGNLFRPLRFAQLFGIWPTGDFRVDPPDLATTYVLIAVLLAGAALGLFYASLSRAWGLVLYAAGATASCLAIVSAGSPWVDGKALATASPALVVAGLAGAACMLEGGRRIEGIVIGLAIAGGVGWSNLLAYRDAWLAPRAQLAELERIGKRFAGEGPALMTEFQPYGVRHFLRHLDSEGASELRRSAVPLRSGRFLEKGAYANLDDFRLDAVLAYRTLVLRRSPSESRPPSPYALVSSGRYYEVWQRPAQGAPVLEHLSLGSGHQPAAVPACRDVLRLARRAGAEGLLAAVPRPSVTVLDLSRASAPAGWRSGDSAGLVPTAGGSVAGDVDVPTEGRYDVWLGGSSRSRVAVSVDGEQVGAVGPRLDHLGQYTLVGGDVVLPAGRHGLRLEYAGPGLRPGGGGSPLALGPVVLSPAAPTRVTFVAPRRARVLCGQRLDWVEAVGS